MDNSNNIRGYEVLLISKIGTRTHPAYDIVCYPEGGGCIRKLNLTEKNAKIDFFEEFSVVFLCEFKNEQNDWEYQLSIPKGKIIKKIENFDERAQAIIDSYPSGMLFPDMLMKDLVFDDEE